VPQTATLDNRFGAAPPALGSSCGISQPFRAGLMFGYRPSGPGFGLPSGDVGYPSLNPTGLGPICGSLPVSHRLCRAGLTFSGRPAGPWRLEGSAGLSSRADNLASLLFA
jgi:hypothetical protein